MSDDVKMIKIKWHLSNGLVGCNREGVVEVEEDCSATEIDEMVREEIDNVIEWGWAKEDDNE